MVKGLNIRYIHPSVMSVEDILTEMEKAMKRNVPIRKIHSPRNIRLNDITDVYILCKGCENEGTALIAYNDASEEIIVDTFNCGYPGRGADNTVRLIMLLSGRNQNDPMIKNIEKTVKDPELVKHALHIEIKQYVDHICVDVIKPQK